MIDILARAEAAGVRLFLKGGDRLGYSSRGPLPLELKALFAEHRREIMAALTADRVKRLDAVRARVMAQWAALRKARFSDEPDPCVEAERAAEKANETALKTARRLVDELAAVGVRPVLDQNGALMLIDERATGRGRDLSRFIAMGRTFEILVKGLDAGLDLGVAQPADPAMPTGCMPARWRNAVEGRDRLIREGWEAAAGQAGWTEAELDALPQLWSRVDLTGVAWLIGERRVIEVTANAIVIETETASRLKFYRRKRP